MRRLSDTVGGVKLFIVGQLETDSSKGTIFVSGVGLPSTSSCKDPEYVLRAWPDRVFFLILKNKAFSKGVTFIPTL